MRCVVVLFTLSACFPSPSPPVCVLLHWWFRVSAGSNAATTRCSSATSARGIIMQRAEASPCRLIGSMPCFAEGVTASARRRSPIQQSLSL